MKQKVDEFNQHEWKIEYPKVRRPYICTAFSPDKSTTCRIFQCRRTEQTVASLCARYSYFIGYTLVNLTNFNFLIHSTQST